MDLWFVGVLEVEATADACEDSSERRVGLFGVDGVGESSQLLASRVPDSVESCITFPFSLSTMWD